jgi:hypothetical protein
MSRNTLRSHHLVRRQVGPDSDCSRRVFISHSTKDRSFVRRLLEILRQEGICYWYSETDIPAGADWHDEIGRALKACDRFLIILSPNAVGSVWVKRELRYALRRYRQDNRIVPVLYRDCKLERLSWVLPDFQYIDCRKGLKTERERLLQALRRCSRTPKRQRRSSAVRS